MMDIRKAVEFKWPHLRFKETGSYKSIEWFDDPESVPTEKEVTAAWDEYVAEKERLAYKEKRREDYPPIGEQLDAIWKTLNQWRLEGQELPQDGDDMLNAILLVKKKHPKK